MPKVIINQKEVNNLRIKGSPVIQQSYRGKNFTKADVRKYVIDFQKKYKEKNITMMVSVNLPFGFRSGKQFSNRGENPIIPDDYEWEETPSFVIYSWKNSKASGGDDDLLNDCLYDCIYEVVGYFRIPKGKKDPENLKQFLRLPRDGKIPIALISRVEEFYGVNINVSGDYRFTSTNRFKFNCPVRLLNEHYSVDKENIQFYNLLKHIPKRTQQLVFCEELHDAVHCYDGINYYTLSYTDYQTEKNQNYFGERAYINELEEGMNITETYDFIMKETEKLKHLTGGRMDLARSGFKCVNEAMKTLHYNFIGLTVPEPINQHEQIWIHNAFMGGMIFSQKCKLETAFSYDMNSMYPSIMSHHSFTFPILQGEFKKIKEIPVSYGIYRVVIHRSGDETVDRLFRFNPLHFYTHYDIHSAKQLNLQVELIQDEEANALLYTQKRANGSIYFKEIVDELYKLKRECKFAKRILNSMWGALSQRNKIKRTTVNTIELEDDELIVDINPTGDFHRITYVKQSKYFKTPYGRLGVFLTSKARYEMTKTLLPYKNNIFRTHTDGFISNIELPLSISPEIGQWKIENTGTCEISNSNKCVFNNV